jgi:GT2 family glycosyltransferase
MDTKKIDVSIVIVNYNTKKLLFDCIKSIQSFEYKYELEIIVVDNNSTDFSKDFILSNFPTVIWIQSEQNLGFGKANNLGANHANGALILLVNSDVYFHENSIDVCVDYFLQNTNIGVLGCKLLNKDGSHQKSTYSRPGSLYNVLKTNHVYCKFFKNRTSTIDAVMGAFMLINKTVYRNVKGFDPDFFMYAEELELCSRIQRKGYKIIYFDKTSVYHFIGGSSSGSDWSLKQNWLSNALLYFKTGGFLNYLFYHFVQHLNFLFNYLVYFSMNESSRKSLNFESKGYFSSYFYYFAIPLLYSRKMGNGKRELKY